MRRLQSRRSSRDRRPGRRQRSTSPSRCGSGTARPTASARRPTPRTCRRSWKRIGLWHPSDSSIMRVCASTTASWARSAPSSRSSATTTCTTKKNSNISLPKTRPWWRRGRSSSRSKTASPRRTPPWPTSRRRSPDLRPRKGPCCRKPCSESRSCRSPFHCTRSRSTSGPAASASSWQMSRVWSSRAGSGRAARPNKRESSSATTSWRSAANRSQALPAASTCSKPRGRARSC
mmetsp:Transcript_14857/g.49786  ORF Transcript_14857/g.49786 Transcript_14857/m.49786 type:complete len:233 (+) Transcript_14857:1627-2325(+)